MKRSITTRTPLNVVHECGDPQQRPAKLARARGPFTGLEQQQQQEHLQHAHSIPARSTPSSKAVLWQTLHLIKTVNAVNTVSANIDAVGSTVPAAAMPATLTAANTSLAACQQAVGLATDLLQAHTHRGNVHLADKALRVAEAAAAATCRRLLQAKQLAIQMQQQQQQQQQHMQAAAAAAALYEDEELADTCSSSCLRLP
uniref:Uncharacterized protein n=1 Tax=Tetradesmus obliquus TaxID=3088 RepID=A0A383WA13_TETOB|eukprot:jgi/Sobl393_1/18482/SZX73939.1